MELLVCGTAAAEGWPALFCTCAACQEARRRGGKDVRSRAAYMLGDRVRVDFGPDSNLHTQKYGLAFERLEHLLITHSHDDHWQPIDLSYRRKGFSVVPEHLLHLWGNEKVERKFLTINGDNWTPLALEFHRVQAWEPFSLGHGLTATALLAAHDRTEECLNYRFDEGDRSVLLGHDTGWYDDPTWEFLTGKPLNLLLLDCTYGPLEQNRNHLGCSWVVKMRDEFARRNALASDARVVATHFSHNGGWLHEELEKYFTPHGISVAYDGLTLTV